MHVNIGNRRIAVFAADDLGGGRHVHPSTADYEMQVFGRDFFQRRPDHRNRVTDRMLIFVEVGNEKMLHGEAFKYENVCKTKRPDSGTVAGGADRRRVELSVRCD